MKIKNKKLIIVVFLVVGIIILSLIGVSYARWSQVIFGTKTSYLSTPTTELEFLESNSEIINIDSAVPMTDEQGKTQGEEFDFQVRTTAAYNTSISYDLILEKLEIDAGKTALEEDNVKVYLEDFSGNQILGPTKISDLNNYVLTSKTNNHSSTNSVIRTKYKLRVWLDENVDVFNNQNKQIKFRININKYSGKNQVDVVVQNGTVTIPQKKCDDYNDVSFNLIPNESGTRASVSCTNNQLARVSNDVLTVQSVNSDTVCTVKYNTTSTVLYEDGTLIINEHFSDSATNHGAVITTYDPLDDSNAYVFNDVTPQLWDYDRHLITRVEIGEVISPINTAYWFRDTNIKYGDFTNLDTSQTVSFEQMFQTVAPIPRSAKEKSNIQPIPLITETDDFVQLPSFLAKTNQNSNDTFTLVGLNNWDTSNVTDMSGMFRYAGDNATTFNIGNLSGWDTSSVTNMSSMFSYAGANATTWTIGDLSNWDTSSVTNMIYMFSYAGYSATTWSSGDLSSWDTSSVTNMSSMFSDAGANATTWTIGDLSNWDTSSVTSMYYMFRSAGRSATTWSIGDLSSWDTSSVTNMISMFSYAGQSATTWTIGDLSNWDTSSVTNMISMFSNAGQSATTWTIGDLSNWDTSSVTSMYYMFDYAGYSATTFDIGDLSNWDTSNVTNMVAMFSNAGYRATWSLDCSNWNVSKVSSNYLFNFNVETKVIPPVWVS